MFCFYAIHLLDGPPITIQQVLRTILNPQVTSYFKHIYMIRIEIQWPLSLQIDPALKLFITLASA